MPSFAQPPEFTRAFKSQGMDSNSIPRFQMVPAGGKRFVVLRNGLGMTLSVGNPAVCNFTEILESALPKGVRTPKQSGDRFFRLEAGSTAVPTTLVATAGGGATVSLILGVKALLSQTVQFHFVSDNAGHRTRRPPAEIKTIVDKVNAIWFTQANVLFTAIGGVSKPRITADLGDPIVFPPAVPNVGMGPTGEILRTKSTNANLNVYFVWRIDVSGNPNDVKALTEIGRARTGVSGLCVFEDKTIGPGQPFQAMAHEWGHHLGLDHLGHGEKDLMFPTIGQRTNLSRADVDLANP